MSLQSVSYNYNDIIIEKITSNHVHDITGKNFGKWNVIGYAGLNKDLKSEWWCWCECNIKKYYILTGSELARGRTTSCGCNIGIENRKRASLHVVATNLGISISDVERIRRIFNGMKQRCYNQLSKDYPIYGGRGVRICDQWLADINLFTEWAVGHGYSKNLTIERKLVNEDYCPSNCAWVSSEDQNRNKTTTVYVSYKGEKRTLISVLNENGIKNGYSVYRNRIVRYGWDIEKTLKSPIRTYEKKICISDLLDELRIAPEVNKKLFCKTHNLDLSTLNRYLKRNEVQEILKSNNAIDTKKGTVIRA